MMDMVQHPAHRMRFDELISGLDAAVSEGLVYERRKGDLSLFCYTKDTVYGAKWDAITEIARGPVVDRKKCCIIATPFPKFWNLGEGDRQAPCEDFDAIEKLDGSLIIAFWHGGWQTATKGSFDSEQARAARFMLPESSISNITLGGTAAALSSGESDGVNA